MPKHPTVSVIVPVFNPGERVEGYTNFLWMALLAVVSLPLWLAPPLWPVLAVAILGWGNQRLLRYDALAEHADRQEMRAIFRARRGHLYLLGQLRALPRRERGRPGQAPEPGDRPRTARTTPSTSSGRVRSRAGSSTGG